MNNNIELLRSICFTYDDMKDITNLGDAFSEKEIEFMVEFKKIYELGLGQLSLFVDKLNEEGYQLDVYSILYYVRLLYNGPLGGYVGSLSEGKRYFHPMPDSMGLLGDITRSPSNVSVTPFTGYPYGCSVGVYNKLPTFMQAGLRAAIPITEDVFRSSLYSSTYIDNTLPLVDKQPRGTSKTPNGNYMIKDVEFFDTLLSISGRIYEEVKKYLRGFEETLEIFDSPPADENYRVFKEFKEYNPFSSEKNESTSTNNKVEKNIKSGDKTLNVTLDLLGDVFDSFERRETVLKVSGDEKDVKYKLSTNKGQLGA